MAYASIFIAGISCLVSVIALLRNSKADMKTDAGQMTEIMVKLNVIDENVTIVY